MTETNTGHAKNVANFVTLIERITALGAAFNPSRASLALSALSTMSTEAQAVLITLDQAEPAYRLAVDAREEIFAPFSKLITRVNSAVKVSGASDEVQETVLTLVRLLQGRRAKAIKDDDPDDDTEHKSASHMGYDERIENFYRLIQLLTSIAEYAPNEPELQLTALETLHTELVAKNTAVTQSEIPLANARIERNQILYAENTGLVDMALDVKEYVKSVFGASSPQYKAISGLRFVKR